MRRSLLFVAVASAAAGIAVFGWAGDNGESRSAAALSNGTTVVQPEEVRGLNVKDGTEKSVGVFDLDRGRKVRLLTADTTDGKSCLIDEDPSLGSSSTCLENGLFGMRKAAFLVSSNGGPERFDELYVGGVVAPSIPSVSLVKTDGSTVELPLTGDGAFLFESTTADLERGILPSGLRLFGPRGKLAHTIVFPSLR